MANIELKKNKVNIGNLTAELRSDVFNGKISDTNVWIESGNICVVSGEQRFEFIDALNELIKKYRI